MIVKYRANNSGGYWWLSENDWRALENSGWVVNWLGKKWLGTLAREASFECETPADAMRSFESATRQDVSYGGCNCCGCPHFFEWDGGYAGGDDCLAYLYPDKGKMTLREAYEAIK